MWKVAYVNVEDQHIKSSVKDLTISVSMCDKLQSLDHRTYVFHINEDVSNLPSDIAKVKCENEMTIIEEVFKLLRDMDIVIFDLLSYSFEYLMAKYRELGGNSTNLFLNKNLEVDPFEMETLTTRWKHLLRIDVDYYKQVEGCNLVWSNVCGGTLLGNKLIRSGK